MKRVFTIMLLSCATYQITFGQPVVDDFEQSNLDQWIILRGIAEISGTYAYADLYSVRLLGASEAAGTRSMIRHRSFEESFGKYRLKIYVLGPQAEAAVRFQYQNERNYYEVISKPKDANKPALELYKVVDGESELLGKVTPLIESNVWYQITIHRTCSGEIFIYTNDVLQISAVDSDLLEAGSIALGTGSESTYFDDITFEQDDGDIMIMIDTSICQGSSLAIGRMTYHQEGHYNDTIAIGNNCDSIIQLSLSLRQPREIHIMDTLCAHQVIILGNDTLRDSGSYQHTTLTSSGCDSTVYLTLWVLNGNTIELDSTICSGDSLQFGKRVIAEPGIYYDTISSGSECHGIVRLTVQIIDDLDFLGPDTTICLQSTGSHALHHPAFVNIHWSNGSLGPTLSIQEPGNYWGEIILSPCTIRDSITVNNWCDPNLSVFVPNAFTPNGDGINDYFLPQFAIPPNRMTLRIFDRFGQLIFTSNNPTLGWDGMLNGHELPPGTYTFSLVAEDNLSSGDVTLIR